MQDFHQGLDAITKQVLALVEEKLLVSTQEL
jgi:hypothetical protein